MRGIVTLEGTQPRGPVRFDLCRLTASDFEALVGRLVRLEHPSAIKPAETGDGGADVLLPDEIGGYAEAWQAKHFCKRIEWAKCDESLEAARQQWSPGFYTFCFPRDLTAAELKTFHKRYRRPDADIAVRAWTGSEIEHRLSSTAEGKRVAGLFFQDAEAERQRMYQAMEAGGRLDNSSHALDRISAAGQFLADRDPYFQYPTASHEAGGAGPPEAPGTVMSLAKHSGSVISRIDVVPRDEDAMSRYAPAVRLSTTNEAAAAQLHAAVTTGQPVDIPEGVDVSFTRLPPGLEHMLDQTFSGRVKIGSAGGPPFDVQLGARSSQGRNVIGLRFHHVEPPRDWDDCLHGVFGGLSVRTMSRTRPPGGEITWNFTHRNDDSPLRDQVAALAFFQRLTEPGAEIVLHRADDPDGEPFVMPAIGIEPSTQTEAMLRFLSDLVVIEDWTSSTIKLPEEWSHRDVATAAEVAMNMRAGGRNITWQDASFVTDEDGLKQLREGGVMRLDHAVAIRLFERDIDVGFQSRTLGENRVDTIDPVAEREGLFRVRLVPINSDAAQIFEHLTSRRRPMTRRPPPPPRKATRKRRKQR